MAGVHVCVCVQLKCQPLSIALKRTGKKKDGKDLGTLFLPPPTTATEEALVNSYVYNKDWSED